MVQCGWFDTAMSQKPGNPGPLSILKSQLVYGYLFPSDMVIRGFHPSPFQKSAAHWSPTVPAGWHAPGARVGSNDLPRLLHVATSAMVY